MEPYKAAYLRLFGRVTKWIEDLEAMQTEAEEYFLAAGDEPPTSKQ